MTADADAPPIVDGAALKGEFLLDPETAFLNHGSFGATPRAVLAEQEALRRRIEKNPPQFFAYDYPPMIRAAADRLGAYLGAQGRDLAFVDNATSGANAVLRSLAFEPGDEILVTSLGYRAVCNAARYVAGRSGATLIEVPIALPVPDAEAVLAAVAARLSRRTRIAIFDHVCSHSAITLPVDRLVPLARAAGALVMVDGAHAPGLIPLDVPAVGADYYVGNCHKWLMAPRGCGFLWAKREYQDGLHPLTISHGFRKGFIAEFDWTGTRDPSAFLSAPAGIAFHARLGGERLMARNTALARSMGRMLAENWGTELVAPAEMFAAMAVIRVPATGSMTQEHAKDIQSRLYRDHKIEAPINCEEGRLWIRVAAQAYNEAGDYERLRRAIAGRRD